MQLTLRRMRASLRSPTIVSEEPILKEDVKGWLAPQLIRDTYVLRTEYRESRCACGLLDPCISHNELLNNHVVGSRNIT